MSVKDKLHKMKNRAVLSVLLAGSAMPGMAQQSGQSGMGGALPPMEVVQSGGNEYIGNLPAEKGFDLETLRVVEDVEKDTERRTTVVADNGVMVMINKHSKGLICCYGIEKDGAVEYHVANGGKYDTIDREAYDNVTRSASVIGALNEVYSKYGNQNSSFSRALSSPEKQASATQQQTTVNDGSIENTPVSWLMAKKLYNPSKKQWSFDGGNSWNWNESTARMSAEIKFRQIQDNWILSKSGKLNEQQEKQLRSDMKKYNLIEFKNPQTGKTSLLNTKSNDDVLKMRGYSNSSLTAAQQLAKQMYNGMS